METEDQHHEEAMPRLRFHARESKEPVEEQGNHTVTKKDHTILCYMEADLKAGTADKGSFRDTAMRWYW